MAPTFVLVARRSYYNVLKLRERVSQGAEAYILVTHLLPWLNSIENLTGQCVNQEFLKSKFSESKI